MTLSRVDVTWGFDDDCERDAESSTAAGSISVRRSKGVALPKIRAANRPQLEKRVNFMVTLVCVMRLKVKVVMVFGRST